MARTQPLRSDLRQGVPPVVPLADRVIGNMRQWLIGIDPTSVQNFRHCSKGCRGVEGACWASLKPSTRRSAEPHLRRHILPLLGECPLTDLAVRKMQTFATTLASGKRTAKTIENVLLTLASILSSARKWGYKVPEVALSDLSLPRKVKVQPRYFSADEMARIVSSADEPLGTICFVLSSTGMRIGEVLALIIGSRTWIIGAS